MTDVERHTWRADVLHARGRLVSLGGDYAAYLAYRMDGRPSPS